MIEKSFSDCQMFDYFLHELCTFNEAIFLNVARFIFHPAQIAHTMHVAEFL